MHWLLGAYPQIPNLKSFINMKHAVIALSLLFWIFTPTHRGGIRSLTLQGKKPTNKSVRERAGILLQAAVTLVTSFGCK